MKIRNLLITIIFALLSGGVASAADDEDCVDVTQAPTVNWSDGTGTLCIPVVGSLNDGSSVPLPTDRVINCLLVFRDGAGTTLGTQDFAGLPGTAHDVSPPEDGLGTSTGTCRLGTETSGEQLVAVVFPSPPSEGEQVSPPIIISR